MSVAESLVERIQILSEIDQRPVAYMAGYLIESSVDDFGRDLFGSWIRKRINNKKEKDYRKMRQTYKAKKVRMLALVADDAIEDLERLADIMDCTPVKLAGLLIDHGVDAQETWVRVFNSPISKPLWWFVGGKATFNKLPEEYPEYVSPWDVEEIGNSPEDDEEKNSDKAPKQKRNQKK